MPRPNAKKKPARKRETLTKRYNIRCNVDELATWEQRARELGYNGASAWLRRLANDAIRSPA